MNAAVVDTDVVSMLFKGDSGALGYRSHIAGRLLGISFMTLAELERWSLERSWGAARTAELKRHLKNYTVLPATRSCVRAGRGSRLKLERRDVRSKPPMPGSPRVRCTIRCRSSQTTMATTQPSRGFSCLRPRNSRRLPRAPR